MRRPVQRDLRDEGGFTLVEVVVALFLLGIVAAAGLTFFFRGMQNTSHLQRSQTAVAVANEAMEKVRSVTPRITDTVTSTSGLLIGRTQTAVQAAWATAAASDTAQSNAVWDTAATTRPKIALPVVDTVARVRPDLHDHHPHRHLLPPQGGERVRPDLREDQPRHHGRPAVPGDGRRQLEAGQDRPVHAPAPAPTGSRR